MAVSHTIGIKYKSNLAIEIKIRYIENYVNNYYLVLRFNNFVKNHIK